MKIYKLSLMLVSFTISTLAYPDSTERSVEFFFSQARGQACSDARKVYDSLTHRHIHDLGGYSFEITGTVTGDDRVVVKLVHTSVRGTGGFGPSGWIEYYNCSYEEY